ncbi:MAG: efflux RND transporter periplasmic adaptor subunit [Candidatus Rokubacteria bacterium]|nr:efflux RND transporter periplasmic adaptor subunit [Candidatus Rokubacteria bacterium]
MIEESKAFLALAVLLLVLGCQGETPGGGPRVEPPTARAVRAHTMAIESVQVTLEAIGTVRSKTQTVVASKVLGYVREVRVNEGERVRSGDLLVAVDQAEHRTRLDRAQGALSEASRSAEEAQRNLDEARAALVAAEADHRYAEATATRFRRLLAQELISVQEFDGVEAKRQSAQALVAQGRARILSLGAREAQAQMRIEQAKAELASAGLGLEDTRITAPVAGVVVEKRVEAGNLASPGQPLLVLDDPRQYRLEAVVGESATGRVRLGAVVPVVIDSLQRPVEGRVAELIPAADPASRSVIVKLDLPADLPLRSGMFGRARFPAGERPALVVPAAAVLERGQLSSLFVIGADGVARLRLVTLGERHGQRVEVLSGLAAGERIVVEGAEGLSDGSRVDVRG